MPHRKKEIVAGLQTRRPNLIQYLAAYGRNFTEWNEKLDRKLVYAIGLVVLLRLLSRLSPLGSRFAEILDIPLALTHYMAVFVLVCGVLNFLCRTLMNRNYPEE
jgi:hypothetical protein